MWQPVFKLWVRAKYMKYSYSEQHIKEKKDRIDSRKSKVVNRIRFYRSIAMVIIVLCIIAAVGVYASVQIREIIGSAPEIDGINEMSGDNKTIIYDTSGAVIQTLDSSAINHKYITIENIPDSVKKAFVAAEDVRFYEHKGIDLKELIQIACISVTNEKVSDDDNSTITQKLLKNQIFGGIKMNSFSERFRRQIQQQWLAVELENDVGKEKILEYYLNTVKMGDDMVGVGAAAKRYFEKEVSELTVSEASVLAAVVSNPSLYNPISGQEDNQQQRKSILKTMVDNHFLSEAEYEDAIGDDVYTRIKEISKKTGAVKNSYNSYYAQAVTESVISDLKEKLGYSETQAYNAVYKEGLIIYSCQQKEIQDISNSVINNDRYYRENTVNYLSYTLVTRSETGDINRYTENDIRLFYKNNKKKKIKLYFTDKQKAYRYIKEFRKRMIGETDEKIYENINFIKQPQASGVVIDQISGHVAAITGSRGEKASDTGSEMAISAKRQPGSALNILSTYIPALDTWGMTLASVQDDAPYKYPNEEWYMKDWEHQDFSGLTTIRDAIVHSRNIAGMKTFMEITPQTGYDYLKNFGFTSLIDKKEGKDGEVYTDIRPETGIGSMSEGVSNLELTAAYAAVANSGTYIKPVFYTKVLDRSGEIVLSNVTEKKKVMKESTAWLITDAMEETIEKGVAKAAASANKNIARAGKYGTTPNRVDNWFEGFTPYYTVGIWVGNDKSRKQLKDDSCIRMWKKIMERIDKKSDFQDKSFTMPSNISTAKICKKSGLLAVEGICDHAKDGSDVRLEFFEKGSEPTTSCNVHVKYKDVLLQKDESSYDADTADTPFLVTK